MKAIYLLRHAKSDWNTPFGNDHERRLNTRGVRSAKEIGKHLSVNVEPPDLVLCSTSTRTRETIDLVLSESNWSAPVTFESGIYEATIQDVLHILNGLPDATEVVMIVGHQPTTGAVATWLLGGIPVEVPTCSFIHLDVDIEDWNTIGPGCARLQHYAVPKHFNDGISD